MFDNEALRLNLFTLYVFIEIGGTGSGCFRYMYSRFLKEASEITGNAVLVEASKMTHEAGVKFSEIGLLFKDPEKIDHIDEKIKTASEKFSELADLEERIYSFLEVSLGLNI